MKLTLKKRKELYQMYASDLKVNVINGKIVSKEDVFKFVEWLFTKYDPRIILSKNQMKMIQEYYYESYMAEDEIEIWED